MSIRSKDLSYDKDASQPAFLQRLRAQNASIDASGRHERPVARPQRLRNGDDDDDAPTYVVEGSSEVLTKEEYEKLTSGGDESGDVGDTCVKGELQAQSPKAAGALPSEDDNETKATRPAVVDAGKTAKKRKVAKVVGGDSADDDEKKKTQDKPKKKIKKKANAVKLSFGDDE